MRNEILIRNGKKTPEKKNKEKDDIHLTDTEIIEKIEKISNLKQKSSTNKNPWLK